MINLENGRLVLNKITLIEYIATRESEEESFFLQSGIAGFNATMQELRDMHSLLNYYFDMETIDNIIVSID